MNTIILAAVIVGAVGIIIGILLGIAGKIFHVEVDERVALVREQLPGNNCGGCGYAGCDALAKAIVDGAAPANACTAGCTADNYAEIGKIMGVSVEAGERMVAHVRCNGKCDAAKIKYNYYGPKDCIRAAVTPGRGPKMCSYGCLGFGSCVKVCEYDAIHLVDGGAVVDPDRCINCGRCIAQCPTGVIERIPYDAAVLVNCSNTEKGKAVKDACTKGCIGCTLCAKVCEAGAITIENNLPHIDYEKCVKCGKCVEKCPTGALIGKIGIS